MKKEKSFNSQACRPVMLSPGENGQATFFKQASAFLELSTV
jgi:hypothetical protein